MSYREGNGGLKDDKLWPELVSFIRSEGYVCLCVGVVYTQQQQQSTRRTKGGEKNKEEGGRREEKKRMEREEKSKREEEEMKLGCDRT